MQRNNHLSVWEDGPVWQDDDEVGSCFLCNKSYNFFNRRHHCRKCGRVVCGSCSERSVKYFPSTVIVSGPGLKAPASQHETYRTCDECAEEIGMIRRALFGVPGIGEDEPTQSNETIEGESRGSSFVSSTSSEDLNDTRHHHHPYSHGNDSTVKYTTRTDTRLLRSSTKSSLNRDGDSDANICPICATNLLKLYIHGRTKNVENISNDDFERFKESHINDCLVAFDFNHDDNERFTSPSAHPRNKMLVFNMPPIPRPQFETIPQQASSVDTIPQNVGSVTSTSTIPEKDVLDNECVICLDELMPGDKVARLECLCVFHYKCIKYWFNKKGFGECPVHFLHK